MPEMPHNPPAGAPTPTQGAARAVPQRAVVDFQSPDTARLTREYAEWVLLYNSIDEALRIVRGIKRMLKAHPDIEHQARLMDEYGRARSIAQGAAFPALTDQEVVGIAEKEFVVLLWNQDFVPIDAIEAKLITILLHEERDVLRGKLRDALLRNQERLTSAPIHLRRGNVPGTIGNWVQDYNERLGTEPVDTLVQTQYFTGSENTKTLTAQEQNAVKRLLTFYEYLKRSSQTPEGLEESPSFIVNGQKKILSKGRVTTLDENEAKRIENAMAFLGQMRAPAGSSATPAPVRTPPGRPAVAPAGVDAVSRLQQVYAGDPAQERVVQDRMRSLMAEVGGKIDALIGRLGTAIDASDRVTVRAALAILARNGKFDALFRNPRVQQTIETVLERRFSSALLPQFRTEPDASPYVILFLQHVLQERLHLPETEAARIAVTLENEYSARGDERYVDLAYGDAEALVFRWSRVQRDGDRLRVSTVSPYR